MSIVTINIDPVSAIKEWRAGAKKEKGKSGRLKLEISSNMKLLKLVIENSVPLDDVIGELSDEVFKELVGEGFDFNQLQKSKIKLPERLKKTDMASWHRKSTDALIHSIYDKIISLQIAYFRGAPAGIRWRVRLLNIYKRIDLLLYHVNKK